MYIVALPCAAKNVQPKLATFLREGKDGNEVMVPLFGSENFVGEVLGGCWKKDSDGDILENTAILSGGHLELTGKSHSAGNSDYHWVVNQHQLLIRDGLVLKVAFQVPSSVSASRAVGIELDLLSQYPSGNDPQDEDDWLKLQFHNDNGTFEYRIRKCVDGTETNVKDWTEVSNRNLVFKLVFNEVKNGSSRIYVDDGETGIFTEIDGSPFGLDLNFDVAYPVLCMETDDATARTVDCDYVTVEHPYSVDLFQHIKFEVPRGDKAGVETLFAEAEDHAVEYAHRITLTISAALIDEDCADFPVLLPISDSAGTTNADLTPIFDELGSESLKLSIRDADMNELYVEVVSWDEVGEFAELWFKANLSSTVDNVFYIYYDVLHADNSAYVGVTGSTPAQAVWNSDYKMVQHMNDLTTSSIKDSTVNGNDGTKKAANEPIEATGKIGKAQQYTDDAKDDDYINCGDISPSFASGDFTLEAWIKPESDGLNLVILSNRDGTVHNYFLWRRNNGNSMSLLLDDGALEIVSSNSAVTNDGLFHYVAVKRSGNTVTFYLDGSPDGTQSNSKNGSSSDDNHIGSFGKGGGLYNFLGKIDEPRMSENIARSSAWVSASYLTQTDSLIEFSAPETLSGGGTIVDLADDSGESVALNAQNEYVRYSMDALSTGRYLALIRIKDTAQVTNDIELSILNSTDATNMNTEEIAVTKTAEGTFKVYQLIFDVEASDVGDDCYIQVLKATADTNIIYVDLFRVVPYDGMNGRCKIFDSNGEASEDDWKEVFSEDHIFVGDCIIQNGLIRVHENESAENGQKLYSWNGTAWNQPLDQLSLLLVSSIKTLSYPYLKHIVNLSSEEVSFDVRLEDSATQNGDYYADIRVTLRRGTPYIQIEVSNVYPLQDIRVNCLNSTALRFGYAGDAEAHGIGDDDLDITANNTTLTDNFLIAFDNAGSTVLAFIAANIQPDSRFQASDGGDLIIEDYTVANLETAKLFVGLLPFSRIATLYTEAEDETLSAGASTSDEADDSGTSAELNAQNESVTWTLDPINNSLPEGRYAVLFRIKDSNQVADDVGLQVYNDDDSTYLNQENAEATKTVTADWAIYQLIFDVDSNDLGDSVSIRVNKALADANTILVDYMLVVPLGDGKSLPADVAHSVLRTVRSQRRPVDRRETV